MISKVELFIFVPLSWIFSKILLQEEMKEKMKLPFL